MGDCQLEYVKKLEKGEMRCSWESRTDSQIRPRTDLLFCGKASLLLMKSPNGLADTTPNGLVCIFADAKINVLPPSSWRQATVHRTVAFEIFESVRELYKKKSTEWWTSFYGDPERTRTVDLQRDRLAC